jgi:glycerate-2-kinase
VPDENGEFAAKAMGFNTMLLTTYLEGEAKEVVHALSSIVKEIKKLKQPS